MSTKHHLDANSKQADKISTYEEAKSLLEKRLIWQHLAQKKIKKDIKAKFRIKAKND